MRELKITTVDERIEKKALHNPYIYAAIHLWKRSMTEEESISEQEFLVRLVLLLDEAYTSLFKECCKYQKRERCDEGIWLGEKEWEKIKERYIHS
jgi:hypothetical protein